MGPSPRGSVDAFDHLRLAGVTRLSLGGRGPADAFVFDPHRLALPCWALALEHREAPAFLITLDRHFDLVPPTAAVPGPEAGVRAFDELARYDLDVRNVDHVLAAMEAGLVGDALVVARARPRGAHTADEWTDRRGRRHRLFHTPTLEPFWRDFSPGTAGMTGAVAEALAAAPTVLLDVDLDCFTTPSDADPTTLVPWTEPLIRDFLGPEHGRAFWSAALSRCAALTLAREPYHCGGLVASGRLFEALARVLFVELLGTDLP